jgi:hypothetical protein
MLATLRMERLETRDTPAAVINPLALFPPQTLALVQQQAALAAQQQLALAAQFQAIFAQSLQQALLRPGTFIQTTPNFNPVQPVVFTTGLGVTTVGNRPFVFTTPAVVTTVGGRPVVFTPAVLPGVTLRPGTFTPFGVNPVLTSLLVGNNLNAATLAAFNQMMGFPLKR